MRKIVTLLLMAWACTAHAQTSLPNSLHTSAQQYVYRITDSEAQYIMQWGLRPAKAEAYLHSLVDSARINAALVEPRHDGQPVLG